ADNTKAPREGLRAHCVYKGGDRRIEAFLGVRERQQEAKPPDGRARLARGLEALLRHQAKPPQVGTIVPASPPSSRQRKPRQPVPGGLLTAAQAAAKLNCSIKTLNAHVAAGDLR